jgi:uncharacterized protein (TIGR03435 family)
MRVCWNSSLERHFQTSALRFECCTMKLFVLVGFCLLTTPVAVSQQQGVRIVNAGFAKQTARANPDVPAQMPVNASPKFEVVTIKPSNLEIPGQGFDVKGRHVTTAKTTVNNMITFAYGIHPNQIVGEPEWLDSQRFDVDGVPDVAGTPNIVQFRTLIRDLLASRFKLVFHPDQRVLSYYALTLTKGGPRLAETSSSANDLPDFSISRLGSLKVRNVSMRDFCVGLQSVVMDKPVVDQTGIEGRYDFALTWTPDDSQFAQTGTRPARLKDDSSAPPGLFTAVQEQLGLKLAPARGSVPVLVIDAVEKPGAN